MRTRNNCFYDFENMFGYYFMKSPGKGFVSFNCNLKLIGFWCLYVYP